MSNTALKKKHTHTQSGAHVSVNMTATMDLDRMCNTHHKCIIKRGEVYLLASHAALLFQPAPIGAVCSRLLHFHCSLPSLFSTHPHLRSARCGPLSLHWLLSPLHLSPPGFCTSFSVLWRLPMLSFISCPLCTCLMLMIYEAGVISLKGISLRRISGVER